MFEKLKHTWFGCYTTSGPVGHGNAYYDEKKNKPAELVGVDQDIYQCDFCGGYTLRHQIRLIKGDKDGKRKGDSNKK